MDHIANLKLALSLNDPSITSVTFLDGEIDDLEFLRGNTFVQDVYVANCRSVRSLEPLKSTRIKILRVIGCNIESLEPLRHNTTIHTLAKRMTAVSHTAR